VEHRPRAEAAPVVDAARRTVRRRRFRLKGQTASGKRRSLSDTLDALVTAARTGAHGGTTSRSVVGTVDIAADDPGLDEADAYVRSAIEDSLARGLVVHESRATYTAPNAPAKPRGTTRRKPRG
jgi:hypothetical protein